MFRVDADLKPELRHGIFVPGREYVAWIRFSNGNSEKHHRIVPDARGMAIKLIGVPGNKLLGDEKNTHDIILISNPAFFVDDLVRYQATLQEFLKGSLWDQFVVALLKLVTMPIHT
jgi:catalase